MEDSIEHHRAREIVDRDKDNVKFQALRHQLAMFSSKVFLEASSSLNALALTSGGDQRHEILGVSLILRIAGELVSVSADLFVEGHHYAAAALLRQIVEVEYLAWAFSARDGDAERWVASDRADREDFFRPSKLRKAAEG